MSKHSRSNSFLGGFFITFAVLLLFVWIPLDTTSGIIEKVRGRYNIGDSMAPTIAAIFLLLGGLILVISEHSVENQKVFGKVEFSFIIPVMIIFITGFLVMRFTGPLLVEVTNLFFTEQREYRLLRATPGWKHVGFFVGGVITVSGVISVVERQFTRRALLTGILVVVLLIAVFDLPFEDLQLPPNGDV